MEPDYGNPAPSPSFKFPVVVPTTDPDATPTQSVSINCAWLPYIRGALYQLVQQATWLGTPDQVQLAQLRAMTLISLFEECSDFNLPFACPYNFTSSQFIWTLHVFGGGASPSTRGSWSSGVGWEDTVQNDGSGQYYTGIAIECSFSSPVVLTSVELDFLVLMGTYYVTIDAWGIEAFDGGSLVGLAQGDPSTIVDGNNIKFLNFSSPTTVDSLLVFVTSGINNVPGAEGDCTISEIRVNGQGHPPC